MLRPSLTPYTRYALEATEYAQEQGCFDVFHHAMYKALWEGGENIGDISVVLGIAEKCGLRASELSERLETGYYTPIIDHQFQQAQNMGIRGIPAFLVNDSLLFSGAQPYEVFKTALERVLAGTENESNEL